MEFPPHLYEIGWMGHRLHITSDVTVGIMIVLALALILVAGWLAFLK